MFVRRQQFHFNCVFFSLFSSGWVVCLLYSYSQFIHEPLIMQCNIYYGILNKLTCIVYQLSRLQRVGRKKVKTRLDVSYETIIIFFSLFHCNAIGGITHQHRKKARFYQEIKAKQSKKKKTNNFFSVDPKWQLVTEYLLLEVVKRDVAW